MAIPIAYNLRNLVVRKTTTIMKMRPGGADWGGGLPGWGSGRVRQAVGRVQGLLAARLTDLAEVLHIERQVLINGPDDVEHCSRRYPDPGDEAVRCPDRF